VILDVGTSPEVQAKLCPILGILYTAMNITGTNVMQCLMSIEIIILFQGMIIERLHLSTWLPFHNVFHSPSLVLLLGSIAQTSPLPALQDDGFVSVTVIGSSVTNSVCGITYDNKA